MWAAVQSRNLAVSSDFVFYFAPNHVIILQEGAGAVTTVLLHAAPRHLKMTIAE